METTDKVAPEGTRRVRLSGRMQPDRKILALLMVYFTVFVDLLGVAKLIPVLPFLVGVRPHADSFSVESMFSLEPGAAMAAIGFSMNCAQFVSVLVFGPLSDRFGRRPLLLSSLVGGALGYALQGVAVTFGSFPYFIAARVLTGLFGGSRAVAVAYIADCVAPEQRPKMMGLLALSVTLGMQFGSVLGGALGTLSLSIPCYTAGAVSAIGAFLVYGLVPETRQAASNQQQAARSDSIPTSRLVALCANTLLSLCAGFWAMSVIFGFSLLFPVKFGFDPNKVGLAALGDGVMILLGNPIYLLLIKKLPVPAVAAMGALLMTGVAVCPHLDLLGTFIVRYVSGIGGPLCIPAASAIVSLLAPPHRRGAWTGVTIGAQALGRTVAPLVVGLAFDIQQSLPFTLAGVVTILGLFACLVMYPLVPRVVHNKQVVVAKAQDATADATSPTPIMDAIEKPHVSEADSETISRHAESLVVRLRDEQEHLRLRLDQIKGGLTLPQEPAASEEQRLEAKIVLGDWLVELLQTNGYANWPQHLDGLKLILFNSFPPLRTDSEFDKLNDLISVFEGHISMAESSLLFDNSEDLMMQMLM